MSAASMAIDEADVGIGQGRGVVDAVADDAHDPALVVQAADLEGLVLGEDPGQKPGDADLAAVDSRDHRGLALSRQRIDQRVEGAGVDAGIA